MNIFSFCAEKPISLCSVYSESASVCKLNLSHKQTRQKREAIHLLPDSTVLVQAVSSLSMSAGVCDVFETEVVLKTVITLAHLHFRALVGFPYISGIKKLLRASHSNGSDIYFLSLKLGFTVPACPHALNKQRVNKSQLTTPFNFFIK